MKRRCPNSKYIGRARLTNYRWQINERGYANVLEEDGHWVDGLVYEINPVDEAKLDINEGVSKNAYMKRSLKVHLHRAPSTLYRRPVSWIVNQGGPAKIARQAKADGHKYAEHQEHWVQDVLVYISLNYIQDSAPKEEYVNRINLGLADAKALGMDQDYISNCIRPSIPAPEAKGTGERDILNPAPRGQKRTASPRIPSPARRGHPPSSPGKQSRQATQSPAPRRRANSGPPPLPPRPSSARPVVRYSDVPVIVVEEFSYSTYSA
ncbi:Gamma-glutamylcyclotransferase-like protein [Emericellopsis cladophorae]|uniref:gamma-glutamylcyclotransferase n=1 Tax=Emericellopsis cladophorae TaxID=2686198 RepID=A0A9P9Y2W9_9HYPO|nr:Gamma-glutamylcyclotransferase-like protein [Emericellopsis cladophorae]KAI6782529.1 Gamma-glutamylcyclotransferase-like protein [Emericellopsis cladophorae]